MPKKISAQTDPDASLAEDPHSFRRPRQARGIAKFDKILDAAHNLIEQKGLDNFGLYDVAEAAGVATGSVYHFFPSLQSIFVALVERYDNEFAEIIAQPVDDEAIESWEDLP